MGDKNMFGYEHEEKASHYIRDTSYFGRNADMPVLALAHAALASLEVHRKIASVLVDIEIAIRDLIKILEKNKKEE